MQDGDNANGAAVGSELVEDPVGPNAQRVHATQPPAQLIAGVGLSPEQRDGLLDGVDQRPVEPEQRQPSGARENDPSHGSAGGPAFGELLLQLLKRNGF